MATLPMNAMDPETLEAFNEVEGQNITDGISKAVQRDGAATFVDSDEAGMVLLKAQYWPMVKAMQAAAEGNRISRAATAILRRIPRET